MKNLVDSNTGEVADSKHGEGNPAWSDHVYNQATFIGASLLLYKATGEKTYLDNAILGADYTMNTMSWNAIRFTAVREWRGTGYLYRYLCGIHGHAGE